MLIVHKKKVFDQLFSSLCLDKFIIYRVEHDMQTQSWPATGCQMISRANATSARHVLARFAAGIIAAFVDRYSVLGAAASGCQVCYSYYRLFYKLNSN